MRLIDADELKKAYFNAIEESSIGEVSILNLIDNAPTVEPETKIVANVTFDKEQLKELVEKAKNDILAQIERPQGEWIFDGEDTFKCSVCNTLHCCGDNFCPNCGADMRGDTK